MQWAPRRIGGAGFRGGRKGRRTLSLLSPNIRITITRSPMRAAGISRSAGLSRVAGISTRKTTMNPAARKTAVAALFREFGSLAAVVTIATTASAVFHLIATRSTRVRPAHRPQIP